MNELKVFIGIPTTDFARYNSFSDCLDKLEKPDGYIIHRAKGNSVAKNRNVIIRLATQAHCSHILFLDDDMSFEPDLLIRLLSHDKDVVSAHCLMRYPPFEPPLVDKFDFGNNLVLHKLSSTDEGLIKIWAGGLACCLIKCEILDKFSEYCSIGFLHHDELSEDISFFIRLEEAGFEAFVDLDCHVGHHIVSTIWPDGTIRMNNKVIGTLTK